MLTALKNMLWGRLSAVVILLFGLYFTVSLAKRGAFGRKRMANAIKSYKSSSECGVSPFASLATALGGTVGIGSITGVGLALETGGAGSIFWFWLCGLVCIGIKYAEVISAASCRVKNNDVTVGGAMYSLKKSGYGKSAVLFAFAGVAASLGTGNMTQASAVGDVMEYGGIPRCVTGLMLAVMVAFAVFGGQKRISRVSAVLVPLAGVIYLVMALFSVVRNGNMLPSAFESIFRSAFGTRQIFGGAAGITVANAMSVGITRCIFSNEAGMGTSPMAHVSAENISPQAMGIMGGAEIIADTFVFSTVTALALLCGGTTDVYTLFSDGCGDIGRIALPILMVIFAYAAMIAWCYYAESCILFLFPTKHRLLMALYRVMVVICAFVGTVVFSGVLWDIADILNSLMMIPDLFDLFIKRKEILRCSGTK